MKKIKELYNRFKIPFWTVIGVGAVFFLWWFISFLTKTTLFPGPQVVIPKFFEVLGEQQTYSAIGGTLLRLVIAMAIGFTLGVIFGIIGGLCKEFRAFMRPIVIVFRTIPTAAVIFVIIALLKPIFAPVIIVFLMVFPMMYDSVVTGITNVDQSVTEAMKVDGTPLLKQIFKVYLPLSWSYILLGLVSAFGLGMKISIMAEVIAGSDSAEGLGKLIRNAANIADMDYVLAYSLIAIALIGLIDIAIYFVKRRIKKQTTKKQRAI